MNGKPGVAPCGHVGVHVTANYVQCPICDRAAIPEHVDPEKTRPICRKCGGDVWVAGAITKCKVCSWAVVGTVEGYDP